MRRLWSDISAHPAGALAFVALWTVTWIVTVLTWKRDPMGHSVGMDLAVLPLHLALPFVLGAIVGRWRGCTVREVPPPCAAAGLVFALAHCALLTLVDAVWLPSVATPQATLDLVAGTVVLVVVYAAIGVVLSIVGGMASVAWKARTLPRRS